MRKAFITGMLILLVNIPFLLAQNSAWTIFNTANSGMPDNTVYSFAIDNTGKKWIGTDYGLAVYNDTAWVVYRTANSGLPHNSVRSIAFDKYNNAWIGTFNGGLAKFNGTLWTVYNTGNCAIPSDFVKCITIDSMDVKWIGTSNGLAKYDNANWSFWNHSNSGFTSENITSIVIEPHNTKIIGTINGGLVYFTDTSYVDYTTQNSNMQDNSVLSLALDSNNSVWIATPAQGLMARLSGSSWLWYHSMNSPNPSDRNNVVIVDKEQNKYIGTLGGLAKLNGSTWAVYDSTNSDLPDNEINTVTKDKDGILWIGTRNGGLARFDEKFTAGINAVSINEQVRIYPNPFTDKINLEWKASPQNEKKHFQLCDAIGRIVKETVVFTPAVSIDLKGIQPGWYTIKLLNNKQVVSITKLVCLGQ